MCAAQMFLLALGGGFGLIRTVVTLGLANDREGARAIGHLVAELGGTCFSLPIFYLKLLN